jgi:hypothetical protein
VPSPSPWDELDPVSLERELWQLDLLPDDPDSLHLRAPDLDPDQLDAPDLLGDRLTARVTRWTLDLDDPYDWSDVPVPAQPDGEG